LASLWKKLAEFERVLCVATAPMKKGGTYTSLSPHGSEKQIN
jgi:hypothetical protein